jgi:hypothetical protein
MAALASLFGMAFRRASNGEAFNRALDESLGATKPGMIELRVDADRSRLVHQGFWELVRRQSIIST